MNNAGGVVTLVLIYLLVVGGLGIGALVSYILRGVGMYTLGKRRGMDYPWLAFIPYARTWFQGELCGTLHFGHKELKSPGIWLLVIPVVGLVYVLEVLSDIIQVAYFKKTHGKRFFRMAPLHHHLELGGWSETKLFCVFSGATLVLCCLAFLGVMDRYPV